MSAIILLSSFLFLKNRSKPANNIISDAQIWWSNEWETIRSDKNIEKTTKFFGSEFRFRVKGGNSLSFRALTDDINDQTFIDIQLDGKNYNLGNYNLNDKRLTVLFNPSDSSKTHNIRGIYYCISGISTCNLRLKEILLDGGSIIPTSETNIKTLGILGDSISLSEADRNYSAILASMINYHLHNAAFWRGTVGVTDGRNPAVLRYKKDIVRYKPDLIIIFIGVNDSISSISSISADSFKKDYDAVIKGIKSGLPNTKIVLVKILPGKYNDNFERNNTFNNVIESLSEDNHVYVVNTAGWLDAEDYANSLHPTAFGQDKLASKLYNFLKQNNLL